VTCKFCRKKLNATVIVGYRNRQIITYRHVDGVYHACKEEHIPPGTEAPECHICRTYTDYHRDFCSAAGLPQYHAQPD